MSLWYILQLMSYVMVAKMILPPYLLLEMPFLFNVGWCKLYEQEQVFGVVNLIIQKRNSNVMILERISSKSILSREFHASVWKMFSTSMQQTCNCDV